MKTDLVQISFLAICLVLAAAVQDMLPAFGGVKMPLLQVLALAAAFGVAGGGKEDGKNVRSHGAFLWLWVVLAAGFLLDALGGVSFGCGTGFLVAVCVLAHILRRIVSDMPPAVLGIVSAMLMAPLNELWLDAWGLAGGDPMPVRFFASAIPAAVAGALLFSMLPRIERRIGLAGEAFA